MSAVLNLEPVQPSEEVSALAADASRRLFRVIGAGQEETCVVRFESAPDEPLVLSVSGHLASGTGQGQRGNARALPRGAHDAGSGEYPERVAAFPGQLGGRPLQDGACVGQKNNVETFLH